MGKFIFGIAGIQYSYFQLGGRGFWPMQLFRAAFAGVPFWNRYHHFGPTFSLGKETDDFTLSAAYKKLANGPIYRSVPGALIGGSGDLLGDRKNGGTATAAILGQVDTINDDINYEILNRTQYRHLLHTGEIRMRFFKRDGQIYVTLRGTGTGNWALLNEIFGEITFSQLIRLNFPTAKKIKKE